jgi:hypothetical protein
MENQSINPDLRWSQISPASDQRMCANRRLPSTPHIGYLLLTDILHHSPTTTTTERILTFFPRMKNASSILAYHPVLLEATQPNPTTAASHRQVHTFYFVLYN